MMSEPNKDTPEAMFPPSGCACGESHAKAYPELENAITHNIGGQPIASRDEAAYQADRAEPLLPEDEEEEEDGPFPYDELEEGSAEIYGTPEAKTQFLATQTNIPSTDKPYTTI